LNNCCFLIFSYKFLFYFYRRRCQKSIIKYWQKTSCTSVGLYTHTHTHTHTHTYIPLEMVLIQCDLDTLLLQTVNFRLCCFALKTVGVFPKIPLGRVKDRVLNDFQQCTALSSICLAKMLRLQSHMTNYYYWVQDLFSLLLLRMTIIH
jgi:hypothetical protein